MNNATSVNLTTPGSDMGPLVYRIVARVRFVGVALLAVLTVLFATVGDPVWRWLTFLSMAFVMAVWIAWDRRQTPKPKSILSLFISVFALQACAIALTGGYEGPFIIAFIPMAFFVSIALGERKRVFLLNLWPILFLWALAGIEVVMDPSELLPQLFDRRSGEPLSEWVGTFTFTFMLTLAIIGGSAIGVAIHRAALQAHHKALLWQREAAEVLRDRNNDLLRLSGALAHELKNPLAAIQGLSSLMAGKAKGSRDGEQLAVILEEARRMESILEDFLSFSRPSTALSLETTDMRRLAQRVVQIHEGMLQERALEVAFDDLDGEPCEVECDPRKVKQILVNLVQNAIEASPRGGRLSVSIQGHREEDVSVIIEDEGAGLDESVEKGHVFSPGITTKPDGSGLGLTIARTLAEQHGGSIHLDNREPRGCRAVLNLPRTFRAEGEV